MAATTWLFIATFLLLSLHLTEAQIGVCYGTKGDNLPCPEDVVDLYELYNIGAMRIYEPNLKILKALQGTDIKLMLGVANEDISSIASDQSTAEAWVQTNVVPYADSIKYIAVGNEIHPSDEQASCMEPAMQNIQKSLNSNDLGDQIKVSTAVDTTLIKNSSPPSHAEFKNLSYITPIINFLTDNDSPLLVNIQPFFAYEQDPNNIKLDYVLFTSCGVVVYDNQTGKGYQNLFDALYDAMYVAINKVAASSNHTSSLKLKDGYYQNAGAKQAVSETGYSSKQKFHTVKYNARKMARQRHHPKQSECGKFEGGHATPEEIGRTFYTNMINHVKKGTPLTPGQELEVYLFAMFDEDQKPGDESERHYGLFTPDEEPKYGILNFCPED